MSAISAVWLYVGWGAVHFETNYGLMQHSPFEIKEKLLKALDREYNVVDMAAVIEIVSILERTPITKEALETTRLGRYINELRRKTRNEQLARRAKDLVRRWRDMILPTPTNPTDAAAAVQNGSNNTSPALSTGAGGGGGGGVGVGGALVVDAVPKTHASNKRLRKDTAYSPDSGQPPPKKVPKVNGVSYRPPPPHDDNDDDPEVVVVIPTHDDNNGTSSCEIVSSSSVAPSSPLPSIPSSQPNTNLKSTKKKGRQKGSSSKSTDNSSSSRRRNSRSDGRSLGGGLGSAGSGGGVTGDDILKEKIASIARTPRVKTTQELVADLRSRAAGDTADDTSIAATVTDASSDRLSSDEMSRNKTEHMAKFLRSQPQAQQQQQHKDNDDDDDVIIVVDLEDEKKPAEVVDKGLKKLQKPARKVSKQMVAVDKEAAPPDQSTPERTLEEILARLPPIDPSAIVWEDSPSPPSSPPSPRIITADDIQRLHTEHVENLNGNFDHVTLPRASASSPFSSPSTHPPPPQPSESADNFREWHETVSRTSYNGELLHILPYVVID